MAAFLSGGAGDMLSALDINILGNKFEGFKHEGNDVFHFKLVRTESDVFDDSNEFPPDMTHQVFGESESVFGYKDLRIEVYCTAGYMKTYVNINYSDKVTPEEFDGMEADDLWKVINENLQPGYITNKDDFISSLSKEKNFKPFGEMVHSCSVTKNNKEKEFVIYKHGVDVPGFLDFHERIQPFLLFYVDAASYIDTDDDKWTFFVIYEKYLSDDKKPMYAFAGYMTIYNYYAYPEKVRPRISQVLVMPPFQKMGLCATLIQTFYNDCFIHPEVLDITVEDPSDAFQRVRDFVDARNCSKLTAFDPDRLKKGFSEGMILEAREKLKLNKKQARRVYEILRLSTTDCSNKAEFKAYRIDIKKRINAPFQKNGRDFEKLKRALNTTELAATLDTLTMEQRMDYLDKEFHEAVDAYRQVLNRLAMSESS